MGDSLDAFFGNFRSRYKHQPEFVQAVEEMVESLKIIVKKDSKYLDVINYLVEPDRIIKFRVPWRDDSGKLNVNIGYRVQFCNAIGPYKGGLRFHPSVDEGILKFLGFEQIFKNALTSLPLGGGKGGSDFDPKNKSDQEVLRFCTSFMSELYKYIGADIDVPAGDIGVGGREIGYLFGVYKKLSGSFTGVLTGKGLDWGGSLLRPEATGYGLLYFLKEIFDYRGEDLSGKVAVISGSGNVAQFAVQKSLEMGIKVITLSDSDGYIFDKKGITKDKLEFVKDLKNQKRGRIQEYVREFKEAEYFKGKTPWMLEDYDIALPCATQNEITKSDAVAMAKNGVEAVAEGANMPSTQGAIDVFKEKKMVFAPAKAANAGGVAVSGLEMSQNSERVCWDRDMVDAKLKGIMKNIHQLCVENVRESDGKYINYQEGANTAGFLKVADSIFDQGFF